MAATLPLLSCFRRIYSRTLAVFFIQTDDNSLCVTQNAGDTSGKERAVLHSNLAACLFARGLLKRCVKECDSAITLDPGSLRARITKARALAALHRPTEANALLDEALRLTTPFSDVAVIELIHDLMSASEPAPSPDVGLAAKLGQAAICDPAPRPAPPARGTAPEAPTERPAERPIDHYPTERPADRSGAGQPVEVQAEERVARHAPRRQDRSPCRETRALDDRAQTHAEASSSSECLHVPSSHVATTPAATVSAA